MKVRVFLPLTLAVACLMIAAPALAGGKVLFIDSYHEGYAWSDGIEQGIKKALERSGAELKVVRMDTKRNPGEDFKKQAAEKVKVAIEEFKPNVVIAADDNASKYVIEPYYKDKDLPIVFCGVNWDAGVYGFPAKNITGMVEVTPVDGLLAELKKMAKGAKVGFLAPDILTGHKEAENVEKVFGLKMTSYFAKDAADWMKGFGELQGKVDMVIIDSDGGLWPETQKEREEFVLKNTKVPTGSAYEFMAPYAIITFAKVAQEQGFWAGKAALDIIGGKSPSEIAVVKNKEGKLIINARIAKASKLEVPYEVISSADKVME
ncbi:MAG: hypothetical protein KQJ78_09010 [Deltaproteobacteria bacterium]|nr:hypothetical protein [Deltaproteobacteria bacterium]